MWHARKDDDAAVVETDAKFTLSLQWGACHRLGYVARAWHRGKHKPRARVRGVGRRQTQSPRGTLVCLIIPVCVLCLVAGTKIVREFFKDRGAVALALCFAVETAIE